MLSIARCRALLGPDCSLNEAQLENLKQELYSLAQITIVGFRRRQPSTKIGPAANDSPSPARHFNLPSATGILPPNDRDALEERAAIQEFEADFDRDQAEKQALLEWAGGNSTQLTNKGKRVRRKRS